MLMNVGHTPGSESMTDGCRADDSETVENSSREASKIESASQPQRKTATNSEGALKMLV